MPAQKFRKRPIVIEAIQWTDDNEAEIQAWAGLSAGTDGQNLFNALDPEDRANCEDPYATAQVFDRLHSTWVLVLPGQWVIRGVQGEFYPIAADVLAQTYERVTRLDDGITTVVA